MIESKKKENDIKILLNQLQNNNHIMEFKSSKTILNKINLHDKKLDSHEGEINDLVKKTDKSNNLLIAVVIFLIITIIGRCYEAYYRLNSIQNDFIKKSEELNSQIELFKRDIENIKEDQKKLNSNIPNEVERQLDKKIIEFNFKILNQLK